MEFLAGSKRWSRNDSDIVPEKSSIGLISSKISSRPDDKLTSSRPALVATSTRDFQTSLPSSQSKDSTWRARRFGTSSGSRILAKETRGGAYVGPEVRGPDVEVLREAAKGGPSRARNIVVRTTDRPRSHTGDQRTAQKSSVLNGHTAVEATLASQPVRSLADLCKLFTATARMMLSHRDVKHLERFVGSQSPIWPHLGMKEAVGPSSGTTAS